MTEPALDNRALLEAVASLERDMGRLRGLLRLRKPRRPRGEPYRTPAVSLGRPRLPSLDSIGETLAVAEGEDYR